MSEETVVIPFGQHAKKMYLSPNDSIFTNMDKLANSNVGYATLLDQAFKLIMNEEFDRIIVFSDFQTYSHPMAINDKNYTFEKYNS